MFEKYWVPHVMSSLLVLYWLRTWFDPDNIGAQIRKNGTDQFPCSLT